MCAEATEEMMFPLLLFCDGWVDEAVAVKSAKSAVEKPMPPRRALLAPEMETVAEGARGAEDRPSNPPDSNCESLSEIEGGKFSPPEKLPD